MPSHNAQTAVEQVLVLLALIGIALLLAAVVGGIADRVQLRARIRIRVRHLDSPATREARHERAVEGLDAGCKRLLAAIPSQRTGGESRAR